MRDLLQQIEQLNEIGVSLSSEHDHRRVLEVILDGACELTGADGGTLYLVRDGATVTFEIMRTTSLGLKLGGREEESIPFAPLPLEIDGAPNESMVVTSAVLRCQTINIADAYEAREFDLSGTRTFDERNGYRTRSLLTVPMCDHEGQVTGVLQLINAVANGAVTEFESADRHMAESLASQAAIALSHKRLIDQQRALFESFIRMIAEAIDEKSPYTGAHCRRVPELTMMLADAAKSVQAGPLADFTLDEQERYALYVAAWLHDCGKITTPDHVMDKAAKLQTVHDRIEEVAARCAVIRQQIHANALRESVAAHGRDDAAAVAKIDNRCERELAELADDLAFLRSANFGRETLDRAERARIERLAERTWIDAAGEVRPLLTVEERDNLLVERGTLNESERLIIQNHVVATIRMLERLPFPSHLRNVTEYAAGHHERVDGKGYPNGLRGEEMSIPARAMAIADIFEALSALDRPYKQPRTLSQSLGIMRSMRDDGHIDPNLFEVFVRSGIHYDYARTHLDPGQLDEVDIDALLR